MAVTIDTHRWYSVIEEDGQFLAALAITENGSGLTEFDSERRFIRWRDGYDDWWQVDD